MDSLSGVATSVDVTRKRSFALCAQGRPSDVPAWPCEIRFLPHWDGRGECREGVEERAFHNRAPGGCDCLLPPGSQGAPLSCVFRVFLCSASPRPLLTFFFLNIFLLYSFFVFLLGLLHALLTWPRPLGVLLLSSSRILGSTIPTPPRSGTSGDPKGWPAGHWSCASLAGGSGFAFCFHPPAWLKFLLDLAQTSSASHLLQSPPRPCPLFPLRQASGTMKYKRWPSSLCTGQRPTGPLRANGCMQRRACFLEIPFRVLLFAVEVQLPLTSVLFPQKALALPGN